MLKKQSVSKKTKACNLNLPSDFIKYAQKEFIKAKLYFGHGTDNALDEAAYLVLGALNLLQSSETNLEKKLSAQKKQKLLKLINRRVKERLPVAYLLKEAWFAGLPFYVDKRVLIPRSPMVELINNKFSPWIDPKKVKRILDLGTGSGCIAICCALAFPNAKVDAVDISESALKVAKINCKKHKVSKRVKLIKSDLFKKLKNEKYDIIISNPPYVGKEEMKTLPKEYIHEPKNALFAGKVGDEIVDVILRDSSKYLSQDGILIVEVGNSEPVVLEKYPHLPFTWLEFEYGTSEVFLLTANQLK